MKQINFSVVVTTYNTKQDLKKCLDSLIAQTFKNFEVHIIDDGSTDNTRALVDEYKDRLPLSYYYQENWGGPARGRNVGIANAKGEWVAFLDADDWWYENKLERVFAHVKGHDVIYHELDYFDEKGSMGRTTNGRVLVSPFFDDLMVNGNCLSNSGTSVRRTMLLRAGGLHEDRNLIAVEDYDLWLRLAKITERFVYISDSLGGYRISETSLSVASANFIKRIHYLTTLYLPFLANEKRKEALLREKYIMARNKLGMGDRSSLNDFLDIFVHSNNLTLKFRGLFFSIQAFFTKSKF